jgi:hypothetical protein
MHELAHALGFASGSLPYWRTADGAPRTPRDAGSGKPVAAPHTCQDGRTHTGIRFPHNTVQVRAGGRGGRGGGRGGGVAVLCGC